MFAYALSESHQGDERDRLILEHLPQVRLIARRIQERLPENISLDDLISAGILGLISAIDNFEPCHNVKLKTYAEYKIRGAILDSLRGLDWAPRQQRKRSKQIQQAIAALEKRLQYAPSEEEIAAELKVPTAEYHEWLVETAGLTLGSLDYTPVEGGRDLLQMLPDTDEDQPLALFERAELKKLLTESIGKLPDVERSVLGLYYQEELTLREISRIMNLHESRISQLKSQAVLRLRSQMQKIWPTQRSA